MQRVLRLLQLRTAVMAVESVPAFLVSLFDCETCCLDGCTDCDGKA